MQTDEEYFADRAEKERSAADRAENARAQIAHLELARAYEELSDALDDAHKPTLPPLG